MKKNVFVAAAAVMMVVMGSCGSVSGDGTETAGDWGGESVSVSVTERETSGGTESEEVTSGETESVTSSVTEGMTTAETSGETEETENEHRYEGFFVRTSEEESRTVTIESDVFPYDCEKMLIAIDTERPYYNDVEPYDCIDLGNIKNYPNLKMLAIIGNQYAPDSIKLINCEVLKGLENLTGMSLNGVAMEGDWLSEISSLKTLGLGYYWNCDWSFLEKLTQVERLTLYDEDISDLSFINNMSSLEVLYLEHTLFNDSSFDGVEENYTVKKLKLSENGSSFPIGDGEYGYTLTDITGVCKLKGLEYLEVSELHLVDVQKQEEYIREQLPECETIIIF
ncbi:MAG: hypothetical protein NC078_05540 [Ruminococcus sp.]|nr:hypothetical protein [Ruminococcus sp.]